MIKKILSLMIVFILIGSTFAYAATPAQTTKQAIETDDEDSGDNFIGQDIEEIGEDVVINIDEYQPRIIRTSLLEEQDVNVYALLKGIPSNPTLSVDKISNINVRPIKITTEPANKKINIGYIRYIKPQGQSSGVMDKFGDVFSGINKGHYPYTDMGQYSTTTLGLTPEINYDNLGTIVVPIKRIPKEANVPDSIDIELEGKIELFVSSDLGHSEMNLVLPQLSESEWQSDKEQYSFYAGYIRAVSISATEAEFDIYDVSGTKITKAPVTIKEHEQKVIRTKSFYDNIRGFGSLFDKYYISLEDIRSRSKTANVVVLKDDGSTYISTLSEGSKLYPGSSWTITSIEQVSSEEAKGREIKRITLKNSNAGLVDKARKKDIITIEYGETLPSSTAPKGTGNPTAPTKEECKVNNNVDYTAIIKDASTKLTEIKKNNDEKIKSGLPTEITEYIFISDGSINNLADILKNEKCSDLAKSTATDMLTQIASYYFEMYNSINYLANLETADPAKKTALETIANSFFSKSEEVKGNIGEKADVYTSQEDVGREERKDYLLNAISAYKEVISNYPDQRKLAAQAQERIARIYWGLNDESNAIRAFETYLSDFADFVSDSEKAGIKVEIDRLKRGLTLKSKAEILPEGKSSSITVYFTDVNLPAGKDAGYAIINVDNGHDIRVMVGSEIADLPGYKVTSITDDEILIKGPDVEPITIDIGDIKKIPVGKTYVTVRAKIANSQREALVKVEPVSERAESFVKFNLHIPIEKRPFELPLFSESLADEINKTQDLIDKLEGIIKSVTQIHNYWVKACYATFGVLMVKNLFSGGSKVEARNEIRDRWIEKCKGAKSFDSCIIDSKNLNDYQHELSIAESAIQKINSGDISGLGIPNPYYKSLVDQGKPAESLKEWYVARELAGADPYGYMRKFLEQDINVAKEAAEIEALTDFKTLDKNYDPAKLKEIFGYEISRQEYISNKEELFSIYRQSIVEKRLTKKFNLDQTQQPLSLRIDKWLEEIGDTKINEEDAAQKALREKLTKDMEGMLSTYTKKYEPPGSIGKYSITVIKIGGKEYYAYRNWGTGEIREIMIKCNPPNEQGCDKGYKRFTATPNKKDEELKPYIGTPPANDLYIKGDTTQAGSALAAGLGILGTAIAAATLEDGTPVYKATISEGTPRETHRPTLTRVKEGARSAGLVYQLSIDATHYVEIEYDSNGRVKDAYVFERAAPNSGIGSRTDRRLKSLREELTTPSVTGSESAGYKKALEDANSCVSKLNSQFSGRKSFSKGDKVTCKGIGTSYTIAESEQEIVSGPNCVDFMDPDDCSMLFNVCDPVICPASRCNLGGNWQVENVVETGLIGSIALCLPNAGEVAVPICITGINAGLQNIDSILKGYKQCLEAQKIKGESVGMCDRIRNIYICDMLWREGLAIFNIKGGLISLITEKAIETAGGGEYGSFKQSFDNTVSSAKYFTQNYARNVFASYDGGSLDEIGTEICKAAVYGKVPGVGDFFDQIQKPESPPQFIAFFDSAPYQDVARVSTSIYSVYYHIYAGENEDISYSVYLRVNEPTAQVYLKPIFLAQNKRLGMGQFADENIDREFATGYNEICVDIQSAKYGRITECGFGKVTTDFGLDYLNDAYLASEAGKKIDSEKECVSEAGRLTDIEYSEGTTFTGSSAQSTVAKAGVGSFSTGLTQTGIVRRCSAVDPDIGSNTDYWKPVGDCGKDDKGRDLGICYLYTENLKNLIKDESNYKKTDATIESLKPQDDGTAAFSLSLLNENEVIKLMSEADMLVLTCKDISTIGNCNDAITFYKTVIAKSDDNAKRATAQLGIGQAYEKKYRASGTAAAGETTTSGIGLKGGDDCVLESESPGPAVNRCELCPKGEYEIKDIAISPVLIPPVLIPPVLGTQTTTYKCQEVKKTEETKKAEAKTAEVTPKDITKTGSEVTLSKDIPKTFKLSNEKHTITLKEIKEDEATFTVKSDNGIEIKIKKGNTANVNIDKSDGDDLQIKLTTIDVTNKKVTITLKSLKGEATAEKETKKAEAAPTEEPPKESKTTKIYLATLDNTAFNEKDITRVVDGEEISVVVEFDEYKKGDIFQTNLYETDFFNLNNDILWSKELSNTISCNKCKLTAKYHIDKKRIDEANLIGDPTLRLGLKKKSSGDIYSDNILVSEPYKIKIEQNPPPRST